MGLQCYTARAGNDSRLFKLHAETDKLITDYVRELKECGYKIIDFPEPEKFRNYFISNVIAKPADLI
jgi:hypothetical protein